VTLNTAVMGAMATPGSEEIVVLARKHSRVTFPSSHWWNLNTWSIFSPLKSQISLVCEVKRVVENRHESLFTVPQHAFCFLQ